MPNQRISELPKIGPLFSSGTHFNYESSPPPYSLLNDERYLMVINPKVSNEIISFSGLYNSCLTHAIHLRGDQNISGQKIFDEDCEINRRLSINSIGPISTGNISGINFMSSTGFFNSVNTHEVTKKALVNTKDIYITEDCFFNSNQESIFKYLSSENVDLNKLKTNSINLSGDIYNSEDLTISGKNLFFKEKINFTQSELSMSNQNLIFENDSDIFLNLSNTGTCHISDKIKIGEDYLMQNGVNSGEVSFDETSFISSVSNTSGKFFGGGEESIAFKTEINSGEKNFDILFPKTFRETPVVSVATENCLTNKTGVNNFLISNIDKYGYQITFDSDIENETSKIHTIAMLNSSSIFSSKKKDIYRSSVDLESGSHQYSINLPNNHEDIKILVSPENLQAEDRFVVSGVNTTGYILNFQNPPQQNFSIHTITTEKEKQRIS